MLFILFTLSEARTISVFFLITSADSTAIHPYLLSTRLNPSPLATMPPPTVFSQVPETWEDWQIAVHLSGNTKHPNQQNHWGSGSNIRKEEYLLLRVLWSIDLAMDDSALADLGLKSRFTRARQWLRNFPPFSVYLQQILSGRVDAKYDPNTNADAWGSGVFEVSACEQHRIGLALNSGRNMPKRQLERRIDEESVNTSLVMFLAALTTKYPLAEG